MNGSIDVTEPAVVPGWWATRCCHMDLEQLAADDIATYRAVHVHVECWPTRNEALSAIAEMWDDSGDPFTATEVREMIE